MTRPYARYQQLAKTYALLRHPVWAWLDVYGDRAEPDEPPKQRRKPGRKRANDNPPTADAVPDNPPVTKAMAEAAAPAAQRLLSFAEIEAKAHSAFLLAEVRDHLMNMNVPPPDPPGSDTHAALLADLETVRLGALRAGNWREARAAVTDRAKLGALAAASQDQEAPPDARPIDVVIEEALASLGAYRDQRDAITAAVHASRDRDRAARGSAGETVSPL